MVACGSDYFNYTNFEEVQYKGVDKFLCIKNKSELLIGGTFYSKDFYLMQIKVIPC